MKAYLVISGLIFGLMTGLHIWRAIAESGSRLLLSLVAIIPAALCIWAFGLLRNLSRS